LDLPGNYVAVHHLLILDEVLGPTAV